MEIIVNSSTLTSKETKSCSTTKSKRKIKLIPCPTNNNNSKNKNYTSLKKNNLNNRNNRLNLNKNDPLNDKLLKNCFNYLGNLKNNLEIEIHNTKGNKKNLSVRSSFRHGSSSHKNTLSSEKNDVNLIHQYKLKTFLLKGKNNHDKEAKIKNFPINLQSYNNFKKTFSNSNLYKNAKLNKHVTSTDSSTKSLNDSGEFKNSIKFNKNKKYHPSISEPTRTKNRKIKNKYYSQYKINKKNDDDIKNLLEKQFEKKVQQNLKFKNNKNVSNDNCSITTNQIESMKSTQSKFNISTIKSEQETKNLSLDNLEKYYIFLKKKIQKLKNEINNIKTEKENLSKFKIQNNKLEYMKNLKEESNKYKVIIEKASKIYDEYTQEILKIRKILKEDKNEF